MSDAAGVLRALTLLARYRQPGATRCGSCALKLLPAYNRLKYTTAVAATLHQEQVALSIKIREGDALPAAVLLSWETMDDATRCSGWVGGPGPCLLRGVQVLLQTAAAGSPLPELD